LLTTLQHAADLLTETFALVSHPDFDYDSVPEQGRVLVDSMRRIIK